MNELLTLDDIGIIQEGSLTDLAERIMFIAMVYGYSAFDINDDLDRPDEEIRMEIMQFIDNCIDYLNHEATDGNVKFIRTPNTIEIVEV